MVFSMALTLPLQVFEKVYSCCYRGRSSQAKAERRLAQLIVADASLRDLLRWRRVSKEFKRAADSRLRDFNRIDIRIYPGLKDLHSHKCERDFFDWHPDFPILLMQTAPNQVGIAVDAQIRPDALHHLLQVLSVFRHSAEQLFMDSPVIDMFMSQVSRAQLDALMAMLRQHRPHRPPACLVQECKAVQVPAPTVVMPCGPFFPKLKKLTVTSTSSQLEHLSRLSTYSVGVELLYHAENLDILCLKIILGGRWCHKPHVRMFKHVARFRQWTDADSLGERYFQQFSGGNRRGY